MKLAETDIGAQMVKHLVADQWDVYQEVCLGRSNRAADIVAIRGPAIMVVEAKSSLSLAVIEQAWMWKHYANYCAIVTPKGPGDFQRRVLDSFGIGAFWLSKHGEAVNGPHPFPAMNRRILPDLRASIRPEHKTHCMAGSQHGRYTAFGATKRSLIAYVAAHNGCTVKDAVSAIKHHYGTDKSAIMALIQWSGTRALPDIVVARRDGKTRFYVSDSHIGDATA